MTGSVPSNTSPVKADVTISTTAANKIGEFNVSPDRKFAYQPFTVEVDGKKHDLIFKVAFPKGTNTKTERENFLSQFTEKRIKIAGKMAVSIGLKKDEVMHVKHDGKGNIQKLVRKGSQGNKIVIKMENIEDEIKKLESSKNKDDLEKLNILKNQLKLFKKMQDVWTHKFDKQLPTVPEAKKTQAQEEAASIISKPYKAMEELKETSPRVTTPEEMTTEDQLMNIYEEDTEHANAPEVNEMSEQDQLFHKELKKLQGSEDLIKERETTVKKLGEGAEKFQKQTENLRIAFLNGVKELFRNYCEEAAIDDYFKQPEATLEQFYQNLMK